MKHRLKPSPVRYIVGAVCLLAAMVCLPAGFIQMVRSLEAGGYGTSGITYALGWLAFGGGLLGLGVALMIWELSVRHGVRH
jgi:hypothetical protein